MNVGRCLIVFLIKYCCSLLFYNIYGYFSLSVVCWQFLSDSMTGTKWPDFAHDIFQWILMTYFCIFILRNYWIWPPTFLNHTRSPYAVCWAFWQYSTLCTRTVLNLSIAPSMMILTNQILYLWSDGNAFDDVWAYKNRLWYISRTVGIIVFIINLWCEYFIFRWRDNG